MGRKRKLPEMARDRLLEVAELLDKGWTPTDIHRRYTGVSYSTIKNLCRCCADTWVARQVIKNGVSYANALYLMRVPEKHRDIGLLDAAIRMSQRELAEFIGSRHLEEKDARTGFYVGTGVTEIDNPNTKKLIQHLEEVLGAQISLQVVRMNADVAKTRFAVQIVTWGFDSVNELIERTELDLIPRPIDIITEATPDGRRCQLHIQCQGTAQLIAAINWMDQKVGKNRDI